MIYYWRLVAASLECFPEKPSWCRNEQVCQGGRFERSNGLDTALYQKNTFYHLEIDLLRFFVSNYLQIMTIIAINDYFGCLRFMRQSFDRIF